MIYNGNKFIFINTNLWKLICDNNKKYDSPIIYKVNSYDITFSLDNIKLSFSHNKNIIDKYTLNNSYNYESNYEKIKKIFDSVINFIILKIKFLMI